jgi:hypothetical protein
MELEFSGPLYASAVSKNVRPLAMAALCGSNAVSTILTSGCCSLARRNPAVVQTLGSHRYAPCASSASLADQVSFQKAVFPQDLLGRCR